MSDPYKILGVPPTATDDEVKSAYRALAKKYHPDNYAGSPVADLADEKMKEINQAYDTIMAQRKGRTTSGAQQTGWGYTGYSSYANPRSGFNDVRNLIMTAGLHGCRADFEWCPCGRARCRMAFSERDRIV